MKEVIYIEKEKNAGTPVEFTHYQDNKKGWRSLDTKDFINTSKIVYLGKCALEGDMFAYYNKYGCIFILKGHLNSGFYNL